MSKTKIKFPSLNGDKIVEQYPLTVEKYRQWLGAFPDLKDLVQEADKQIYSNTLKSIFYFNPRALYEFFDQAGIELTIEMEKASNKWSYSIWRVGSLQAGVAGFESRIEAEEQGFQECFETLEKRLKG